MRIAARSAVFLGILLVAGCRCIYDQDIEKEMLADWYPPGSLRQEVLQRHDPPSRSYTIPEDYLDSELPPEIKWYLQRPELAAERPRDVDVFSVLISTTSQPFGFPNLYLDYVFYDSEGRVIHTFRRFLD